MFLVLPFEPRASVLSVAGLRTTLLELCAAASALVLLVLGRSRLVTLLRRPPAALAFLAGLAAVHLASAALAPSHRGLALRFALRFLAALVFALAVAVAPRRARRWALGALAAASVLGAALALAEGTGVRAVDAWLQLFREREFMLGDARRATAGAAGPNQAAALLAAGLVAGVAVLERRLLLLVPFGALLATGLALTYSRGGQAAALAGLLALAVARRGRRRPPLVAMLVVAAVFGAFLLGPRYRERVQAEITARAYGVDYRPLDASVRLAPRERRALAIDVANSGARAWSLADRPNLSAYLYEWPSLRPAGVWDRPLGRAVPPGATERVEVGVAAPARPGTYVLAWDLFTLPTAYFSTSIVPPALVPVGVDVDPPADVHVPPGAWRRGRLELWRIAIAMWRDRPLLGVGPDNFRRLHPQYGGWLAPAFQPTTAHNLFLEAAADTGTLGLLCLVGTLAFAARGAWRRRAGEAAAWAALGLLAALAVQGQVEALLEYTGCYLLLAFAVGAATARGWDAGGERRTGQGPGPAVACGGEGGGS